MLEWSSVWKLGSSRMSAKNKWSERNTEVRSWHVIDNSKMRNVEWYSIKHMSQGAVSPKLMSTDLKLKGTTSTVNKVKMYERKPPLICSWEALQGELHAGTTGCSLRKPGKREDKNFYMFSLSQIVILLLFPNKLIFLVKYLAILFLRLTSERIVIIG